MDALPLALLFATMMKSTNVNYNGRMFLFIVLSLLCLCFLTFLASQVPSLFNTLHFCQCQVCPQHAQGCLPFIQTLHMESKPTHKKEVGFTHSFLHCGIVCKYNFFQWLIPVCNKSISSGLPWNNFESPHHMLH